MENLKTKIAIMDSKLTRLTNSEIEIQQVVRSIAMNSLNVSRVTKL